MDFLKDQAEKYINKQSHGGEQQQMQAGGYPSQQGGGYSQQGGYPPQGNQGGFPQQGGPQQGAKPGGGVNFSDGIQASDIMGLMGKGGSGINLMDGIQASDLKGLAGAFKKVQSNPNANEHDPSSVVNALGGSQQANNAIGGLLGAFKGQTGQHYTGEGQQTDMLAKMAHEITGINIPPSVLGKLAQTHLQGGL